MKICIWFKTTARPWGGGNQFLSALGGELMKKGHEVTCTPNTPGTQLILLNSFLKGPGQYLSTREIAQLRHTGDISEWSKLLPHWVWFPIVRRGPLLFHRLDGIPSFYRGEKGKADTLQSMINRLTDFTIFQSQYSRGSFAGLGVTPSRARIIHNGVDPLIFYPPASPLGFRGNRTLRLISVSWSSNPGKGFTVLSRLSQLPNVEVLFVGRWCPSIPPAKVTLLGEMPSLEVAEVLRHSDAFIQAGEHETCSNALLEALACGLPILFRDSGANKELAQPYGTALTNNLGEDLERFRAGYIEFRERALEDRRRFLIDYAADQYLSAFEEAMGSEKHANKTLR